MAIPALVAQLTASTMSALHALDAALQHGCASVHYRRRPLRVSTLRSGAGWGCFATYKQGGLRRKAHKQASAKVVAAVVAERAKPVDRIPTLPFVKIAGQEDMKLAILLNVIDPKIGGVLIMGDRGTGKSVAVSPVLLQADCGNCKLTHLEQ